MAKNGSLNRLETQLFRIETKNNYQSFVYFKYLFINNYCQLNRL
jgi:hypothetical protein